MKRHFLHRILVLSAFVFWGQVYLTNISLAQVPGIRQPFDTVGFATHSWQMDSIITRINRDQGKLLRNTLSESGVDDLTTWKVVISPHDDYSYVGYLYPAILKNLKAKTIILFGVAHKARQLGLQDQIIFGDYPEWKEPGGNVKVSPLREEIMKELPAGTYQVNDSMQSLEHSIEALIPFIQYNDPEVEIVPIVVPYMTFDRANDIAKSLAEAIYKAAEKKNWVWGQDYAIAISSDAVHYGDQDWGGSNYAFYGADTAGYIAAVQHEWEIINTISDRLTPDKVRTFTTLTVDDKDYKQYRWTWCGRYSIPMGLLTSYYLASLYGEELLGTPVGYATSIDHKHLRVDDIGMDITAPANIHHWVGYPAIGYK
jgi:AmmeMemoRadiSam system protein B